MSFWRSVRATPSEHLRGLPGDELIHEPIAALTHAITIAAPREDVWPWLAQMGAGERGGWYSYDIFDNAGRASSTRIVRELEHLSTGMVFPALPGAKDGFTLLAFRPGRFLILGWQLPDRRLLMTWAFVLEDVGRGRARLITRARGGHGYQFHGLPWWLAKRIVPMVHFIMERRQLLGIAERAEASARVNGNA